jgi:hypothetical protein
MACLSLLIDCVKGVAGLSALVIQSETEKRKVDPMLLIAVSRNENDRHTASPAS